MPTLTISEGLYKRLTSYAERRNTTPEKIAIRYLEQSLPARLPEVISCPGCGKSFITYKGQLFCSKACYQSTPFPRKGIRWFEISETYGHTIDEAATMLNVSAVQMRRFVNKNNLRDRYITNVKRNAPMP